ncbi:unnamed protein product, partial [Cladocopium goreaui]
DVARRGAGVASALVALLLAAPSAARSSGRAKENGPFTFQDSTPEELLEAVKALEAPSRSPEAVLAAIDEFAWQKQWLMNVGDVKGRVLDAALKEALRLNSGRAAFTALELGTYLGYSAVRLARLLPPSGRLFSIEKDEEKLRVATEVLKISQLNTKVTLLAGTAVAQTAELVRRNVKLDFVFIDHRKQDYLPALLRLEEADLLNPRAVVVADNVGLMEINDYAEYVRSSGKYLSAFVESEVEYFSEDDQRGRGPLTDGLEVSVFLGNLSMQSVAAEKGDPARRMTTNKTCGHLLASYADVRSSHIYDSYMTSEPVLEGLQRLENDA